MYTSNKHSTTDDNVYGDVIMNMPGSQDLLQIHSSSSALLQDKVSNDNSSNSQNKAETEENANHSTNNGCVV